MKNLLLYFCFLLTYLNAFSTVHLVQVTSQFTFSPNVVNAQVGDTIRWQHTGGNHTTTSGIIPIGAASWNQSMNSGQVFNYVLTVAGTYNYVCTPHSGSMTGTINVAPVSGLSLNQPSYFNVVFEDSGDEIWINIKDYSPKSIALTMYSLDGKIVLEREVAGSRVQIPLYNLQAGLYIVKLNIDGMAYERRVVAGTTQKSGRH